VQYSHPGYLLFVRGQTLMAHEFDADRLETRGDPFPIMEGVRANAANAGGAFSVSADGMLVFRTGAADLDSFLIASVG